MREPSVDENGNSPSDRELAQIHGVSKGLVYRIKNRMIWKHVSLLAPVNRDSPGGV